MDVEVKFEYVSDNTRLDQLCTQWMEKGVLALDTEFMRVSTFYPIAGLIQVGDHDNCYLLDPVSITDWRSFIDVLQCIHVTKVLHSCSEDLVLFYHMFGCVPQPLFDTQRAAAFLGYGFSISYLNLVLKLMNIVLEKGQTRSDWLQRPLSDQQLKYAALDVVYLPELHDQLKSSLQQKSFFGFFQADCERLSQTAIDAEDESGWQDLYLGMGASWRLDRSQLGALKPLCVWREHTARARNKPRSWVARDVDLIQLATAMPADRSSLASIQDLSRNLYQQDSEQIVSIIKNSHPVSEQEAEMVEGLPLTQTQRAVLKKCQHHVEKISEKTGIAVELLARKKQLVQLLHMNLTPGPSDTLKWPPSLNSGWQKDLLADGLAGILIREAD